MASLSATVPSARAAEPFYVSLRYGVQDASAGCWDEGEFRRSVARGLGYDPFRADAPTSIDVQVHNAGGHVDGEVEWHDAAGARMGERRFVGKDGSCTKLLTEMSFAVGLQIELLRPPASGTPRETAGAPSVEPATSATSATPSHPAPGPSGTPNRANPPATKPAASPTITPRGDGAAPASSAPSAPWQAWLGVGPSLAVGLSPSLTAQGRLFVGARRGELSLELGAEGTLPVVDRQADQSGIRQHLLGASASFCGHRSVFAACLLGKAMELSVAGVGVDQPKAPSALVVQAGVRLAATAEISKIWRLTPHVDGLGLLTRRSVTLNRVEVWDMPLLSLLAGIDLGARFR